MPNFTKDQTLAIKEEGNIIVSAGAGSGKTAVLSERVLYYIKEKNYSISDFLILTFTHLAAGEMKARIRQKLIKNKLDDANYVDISDITTFDGFSNALVKKYHSYLNLSSNFSNVDSNIIMVLKHRYIREELDKLYTTHNQTFLDFVDQYCFKDDSNIEKLILDILNEGDLELDKENYFNTFIDNYYSSQVIDLVFETLFDALKMKRSMITSSINLLPDLYDKEGNSIIDINQNNFDELDAINDYDLLLNTLGDFKLVLPRKYKDDLSEEELNNLERLQGIIKKTKDYCKKLTNKENGKELILSHKEIFGLLIEIVKKVDKRQFEFKMEHQVFEFSDIGKFALSLVKNFPSIREELKNKYKMIMIDEYQDTNDLQENFISYIQNNNVYCVGDIKQSIYAFRNAKCDIFKNKYQKYKLNQGGKAIDLKMNFRSRMEVLDDINTIFKNIMTSSFGGADYLNDHMIDYGNKSYLDEISENQNNHLEVYTYKKGDANKEARIIANDIINKINSKYQVMQPSDSSWKLVPCQFKDFAIIIDRGTSFDEYIRVFNEYQIPLFVEKDEDIKDNVIVGLLKNILILIKYIKDRTAIDYDFKHAFVSLARSFIFNYSDETIYNLTTNNQYENNEIYKILKDEIEKNIDSDSFTLFYSVIQRLEIFSLFSRIGNIEENTAYLDSFINSFNQMSGLDFSFDDFITYLDNINDYDLKFTLSSKGTTINSVRLLNIHKSKGLEFNIVYFPGLNKKFPDQDKRKSFGLSPVFGPYLNEDISLVKQASNYKIEMDNISERIRLFYVSLTRAREKMIFVMPLKDDYQSKEVYLSNSFYDFFYPYKNHFKLVDFENYQEQKLRNEKTQIDKIRFNLKNIEFDFMIEEKTSKASKEIDNGVNKKALEYGNKLHFALEMIDFINPDYSIIDDYSIRNKIKSFVNSDILKDVSKAKVFKEYEFEDKNNLTKGVIDLFLKYEDRIILIDYKTKNIDDSHYDEQIKVYYNFLKSKYNLNIEAYLYSIIDEKYRKIEF